MSATHPPTPHKPTPPTVKTGTPKLFEDPLPLDDQNRARLPVYYKEMVNHVADITMRLNSRGPLGAGLSALYTTFPLMGLPGLIKMLDEDPSFVAFATVKSWGMNPLWWAANRGQPATVAAVLYHEADHIVNNDPLNTIKLVKALAKQGVATVKFDDKNPDPVTGDWQEAMGYSMEHAAHWVQAYHNLALDLFCDDVAHLKASDAENINAPMLRSHQKNMCDALGGAASSIEQMTGVKPNRHANRLLSRLDDIKSSGRTEALQRLEWSLELASAIPIVDMSQMGGGGQDDPDGDQESDSQGGGGLSAPDNDSQSMGDVKTDEPGSGDGDGDGDGDGVDNSAQGLAEQAAQLSEDDIDRLSREHDTKMKTASRMAGNSPLFEKFKMRVQQEAKRDYKSILAEGLTLAAYSNDGRKSLARPYLPDLSRRMVRPTNRGEPTVQALAMLDTSGSMSWGSVGSRHESEAVVAVREMLALIKTTPLDYMVVLPCDARVHTPLILERDMGESDTNAMAEQLSQMMVEGGGGTAFSPPFTWLYRPPKEHKATVREWQSMSEGGPPFSACIYYTDGHGRLPTTEQVMRVQNFWGGGSHLYWCMPKDSPIAQPIRSQSHVYGRALWMD